MTFRKEQPWLCTLGALCALLSICTCKTVRYRIYEEDAPGAVIGTLAEELPLNVPGGFRLMKQFNSSLLRMRESDGQLSIAQRIDREQICGQSLPCTLALDVVSFSKEQFRLVHVEVEVRDINDNAPRFPQPEIPLEVSESAAVGTRLPLDIAIDEDVGTNSIQSYQISVNSHFSLEVQTRADGVKYADLVLVKELDRETQGSYTLELVAQDGGSPALAGTAAVTIQVLDFNDHIPRFEQSLVTVELLEDAPVGFLLLHLNAVDPDEGVNGQVVYGFSSQVSSEVRQLFTIGSRSGRLTLEGQVDFETKQTYEFDVQAQDLGPSPLSASCKIVVHITDVNDNAPSITITPLTSITAGVAYITEAASRESFVALISTLDSDSGPNGQVHCTLYGHEHFKLQQAYEDSYMIVTSTSLDREKIAEYNLTIVAEDLGSPPFKTTQQFTIRVSDENDNAPFFAKPVYEVSVHENNAPGAYITTVVARDPDLGHNGKVTYRLLDTEVMGAPLSSFLTVEPDTGSLYAVRSFDFENLKEIELQIEASDGGLPQLSSRAIIRMKIVDQNDNVPIITFPILRNDSADILLPRSAPANYLAVQIRARDADEGVNSQLYFTILQDTQKLFAINKVTGELYTKRRPDSDGAEDAVSVIITVSDTGAPPLSATAEVHFILTDAAPSSVQIVVLPSTEEDYDTSIISIALLAGGCGLLLSAIICVAATCKKAPRDLRSKQGRLLHNPTPSEASSSNEPETPSDSCHLSISTESECSDTPLPEESGQSENPDPTQGRGRSTDHKGSTPTLFHPVSLWCEGKSALNLSSHLDQFSVKDSGKGDSDFNDSDSDLNSEGLKERAEDTIKRQSVVPAQEERQVYNHTGSFCRYPSLELPRSQHFLSQYENGYMITHSLRPVYKQGSPLHKPAYHLQHQNLRDSYQIQIAKSERLQSVYERVSPNSGPLMTPVTLSRGCKELHHPPRTIVNIDTSVIATSF